MQTKYFRTVIDILEIPIIMISVWNIIQLRNYMENNMNFSIAFNQELNRTGSTARELAEASGLSPSTISRFRRGYRTPNQEQLEKLIKGFDRLGKEKLIEIDENAIRILFQTKEANPEVDWQRFLKNFNAAIEILNISVSGLAKALSFDPSFLSRIRNGQRCPADPSRFITETAQYIARVKDPDTIAALMECSAKKLNSTEKCAASLCEWFSNGAVRKKDYIENLLNRIEAFRIDDYIRPGDVTEALFTFEMNNIMIPNTYYGFEEMKQGELDFFRTVILSDTTGTVFMSNSIPIKDLRADASYMKMWMMHIAMMIRKGMEIRIIHDVDRPESEMIIGLMNWIPLYMTGKISPYYLNCQNDRIFCHTDYSAPVTALSGECIRGFHNEGKYYLTQNRKESAYYRKRAEHLFSKAKPLMEIYRLDDQKKFYSFEDDTASSGGTRRNILSALPTYTIPYDVLESMMKNNNLAENEKEQIRLYITRQKKMAETILKNGSIQDEISVLGEAEFAKETEYLSLSGMFFEKDIAYTYPEYLQHLEATKQFASNHTGYDLHTDAEYVFKSIQIQINEGKWVIVSRNNAPAIHFVIRHPKMIRAFERFCKQEIEQ